MFDVDGTLMNVDERVFDAKNNAEPGKRMNWDTFLDPRSMKELDTPNGDVVLMCHLLSRVGRIIITSARNERHRKVTTEQLWACGIMFEKLYLRDDGDFRHDDIVKEELLTKIRSDGYDPKIVFDDRDQVVKKWRELGLICYQVREGAF